MANGRVWTIRGRQITDESAAFVVAEIGHNHMGNLHLAETMVAVAAESRADAVKLQKRSPAFYSALRARGLGEYAAVREGRELDVEQYIDLGQYAHCFNLAFIATAFDPESLDFLVRVGVDAIKLASCGIFSQTLVSDAAKTGLPLLLSTGCADASDIHRAMATVLPINKNVALLQCTSSYPCQSQHLNLGVIEAYRRDYPETIVGLSSHCRENTYEPLAYRLGARIFEKHFTLDRTMGEGDHANSLEPEGLRDLVRRLKAPCPEITDQEYLMMYGDNHKRRLECETDGMRRLYPWKER